MTAVKWIKGVLDYHSAKALLSKGDAITDADLEDFAKNYTMLLSSDKCDGGIDEEIMSTS